MESARAPTNVPVVGHPPSHSFTPTKILLYAALAILMYIAHTAFIPVALALLFALVLSGPVEALHRKRIPRSVSATIILVLALTAIGAITWGMWAPAQNWFAKAPQTMAIMRHKLGPIVKFTDRLDELRKSAGNIGSSGKPATGVAGAEAAPPDQSMPAMILDVTATAIAGALTFVIVTLFLLTGGTPMMARMGAAFADNVHSAYVLHMINKVRAEVGHFYLTTTLLNCGLGLSTGLVMWAWGMPTPYLWGALAALLNFIPYAGAITTLTLITLVAIVSFDTLGPVIGVAGSYVGLATIDGQIAQPLLVGRRMEVNPLLIFLALWFGGLFWGIAGVILATPTLVALRVIAENSKSGTAMTIFLGPNNQSAARDVRLRKLVQRRR
jgi:predicted PurR-regulated permease PerM